MHNSLNRSKLGLQNDFDCAPVVRPALPMTHTRAVCLYESGRRRVSNVAVQQRLLRDTRIHFQLEATSQQFNHRAVPLTAHSALQKPARATPEHGDLQRVTALDVFFALLWCSTPASTEPWGLLCWCPS